MDSSGELAGGTTPVFVKALGGVGLVDARNHSGRMGRPALAALSGCDGRTARAAQVADLRRRAFVLGFVISIAVNGAHSEPWYAIAQAAPFSIAALPT